MSASVSNEYGSAHDSLCPVLDPVNYWDDCQCDLIAKVRETTPPSCVCKFGRGYAAALRDAVAVMRERHPRCTDPCDMCAEWDEAINGIEALGGEQ